MTDRKGLLLRFQCAKCNRTLGFYIGEVYWMVSKGKLVTNPEIYCLDCWMKERIKVLKYEKANPS